MTDWTSKWLGAVGGASTPTDGQEQAKRILEQCLWFVTYKDGRPQYSAQVPHEATKEIIGGGTQSPWNTLRYSPFKVDWL